MPKYIIERELPGAGKLSKQDLQNISQRSCGVIRGMNHSIQWIESFVSEDKIIEVYLSPDKESLQEHSRLGDFPANRIEEVKEVIGPAWGES